MQNRASGDANRLHGIIRGACRAAALVVVLVLPVLAQADDPQVPPGKGAYIGGAPAELSNDETARLQLMLSRAVKVGKTPIKLALEGTFYAAQADPLGQDWMIGFNITPVVPNVLASWARRTEALTRQAVATQSGRH